MGWLDIALQETAEYPHPETLDTFGASIDPQWIEQALAATGTATLRRRRLPAQQVIWLVLGMALLRNRPITEVVSKLDLALPNATGKTKVAPSAIVQARKRLGEQPLQWLFERCSQQWAFDSARSNAWRGLSLLAVDGTNLRVADSDENRDHFGLASGGKRGDSGYPLVRMASLIAVRSHLVAAAAFGPYATSEYAYAKKLWPIVPDDSLTTHMLQRKETIRSQTVAGVRQQLWGILLTYNLIRLEMEQIARQANVPPNRISFVTAMRFIRDQWAWCAVASPGSIPKKLQLMRQRIIDFLLPPRRSERRYPPAVKIKMSNYPKKQRESNTKAAK